MATSKQQAKDKFDWANKGPAFVIQKHDATNLHYDFRIEVNGVLKSWVVPKGPSTDPSEQRLAIPTDDHKLNYADFEGTIPDEEYGGGTVMVWDRGSYRNLKSESDSNEGKSVEQQIDDGHITIWLEGEKLTGGYALTRTDMGDDERWLLVKMDDDKADARRNPVSTEAESVKSDRSLADIKKQE
ncbi:DNA ligase D, 3'-phosphoesterase domain-containing protein [Pseudidiomarina planktonica]|uniref:DNA ligase D, 3'-phosphoesterase domain-containing protein n=1 Tax=Pseudidiomarina planktonica TaxID=1323738 RepID=A0A1Y6FYJ8_9GAMM|nr:DNA polymerase ligase N-terminal domain-containing protein [Pseudidiomarina planktonica]RUO63258.1 DNA ligase [Pseudidiomarina planktonica]SMQ80528.1 DNA ligase D, 3'-phosphoesterase domain-containing protein [Pseudidiomarina planktonica]